MITFHPHNHPVIPTLKITIVKYIKLTQWINQGPTVNELQSWDSPRTIYAFLFVLKHRQKGAVLWGLLWLTGNSEVGSTVCVTDSGKVHVGHHHTVYVRVLSLQSWGPLSFKHACFGGIRLYLPGYSAFMFNTLIWTKVSHVFPCCRGLWKVYFIICLIQSIFNLPLNHF